MPDPIPTPQALHTGAELKQAQRENAQKAAAVKAGRTLERKAILESVGAATLEELKQLPHLRQAHHEELERARQLVGGRAWWRGLTMGLAVAVMAACASVYAGWYIANAGMMALVAADRARTARANLPAEIEPFDVPYERNRREPADADSN